MEQDNLKILEQMLKELRVRVIEDEDIKKMFLSNFPELDFEETVDRTLADLLEYAVEKDYDVLNLSLQGVKLFFSSVLSNLDESDESDEKDVYETKGDSDNYGKA
jgi:hypothetical protein